MARKIDKPIGPDEERQLEAAAHAASDAAAMDVLHPDRTLPIAKRVVTVREYGHVEGRTLAPGMAAFMDDLYADLRRDGPAPKYDSIEALIDKHVVVVQWLVAHAITPLDEEHPDAFIAAVRENARWISTLDDEEGDLLFLAWWAANKDFFFRRLRRRAKANLLAATSAPASSTPP